MKRTLILIGLLSCVCAFAAPQRELVWPKGKMPDAQEHQIAAMTNESSPPYPDGRNLISPQSISSY